MTISMRSGKRGTTIRASGKDAMALFAAMTRHNLDKEVADFNRRFPVGSEVDYFEVIGMGEPRRYRTRTEADVLSGHSAVVWLDGKSGCVACSHCFMPPAVPA